MKITSGNAETYVDVHVTNKVDELYATVNNLALSPGEKVNLDVKAYYNDSLLTCSNESFIWSCTEGIGTINNKGIFTASSEAGVSGSITVSHGSASFNVMVTVGQLPKEITGFENDSCGNGNGQWRNTHVGSSGSATVSINDDLDYVKYGTKSLKIDFKLANTTGTVGAQINTGSSLQIEGTPTAIGMWVYATPSSQGAWIRIQYAQTGSTGALYADFGEINWTGWKYLEAQIQAGVTYPISVKYLVRIMAVSESQRINGTIYVDQLRAVYGFSNDDFNAPEITNITPAENGVSNTTTQTVSFDITDDMSGINKDKTEFYLDGKKIDNILFKEIKGGYNVAWTPSSLIPLTEGEHTIKVRIEDNYENFTTKEWKLIVNSKAASFTLDYNKDVEVLKENIITINSSNLLFKTAKFELSYDSTKVEIIEVTGLNGIQVTTTTDDKYIVSATNSNFVEEGKPIIQIKCKALVEGEATISFINTEFESTSIEGLKAPMSLNNVVLNAQAPSYDYTNFIELVNKIDENNVLSSLDNLRLAYAEYNSFDKENISDENTLSAISKLEKAIENYNNILEVLESVNQSSSQLESLLGGR